MSTDIAGIPRDAITTVVAVLADLGRDDLRDEFLQGYQDRVGTFIDDPNVPHQIALERWVREWLVSVLHAAHGVDIDDDSDLGEPSTLAESRARVTAA